MKLSHSIYFHSGLLKFFIILVRPSTFSGASQPVRKPTRPCPLQPALKYKPTHP